MPAVHARDARFPLPMSQTATDHQEPTPPEAVPANGTAASATSPPIKFGQTALHILLSLLVLGAIGYFTFDPGAFQQMLQTINPWWLLAAVGTVGLRVLFGGWRLSFISQGRLDLMAGIRGQLAWDFFSNVTPSAVGGSPFATLYIARDRNLPIGEATAFMLFSLLMDQFWLAAMIPLTLVAAFYLDVFPDTLGTVGTGAFVGYFLVMLTWVMVFGYATLVRPDVLQRLAARLFRFRLLRRFQERVIGELQKLGHHAELIRAQPLSFFLKGFLLTAGGWMARYLLGVFIVWSVFAEFDKLLFFLRTVAMMLGTMILPTPGGSGGIEGLYVLFLAPLMPKALVAPTLLTWRILGYYIFLALGIFLSMHQVQKSLQRKRQDAKDEAAPSVAAPTPVSSAPQLREAEPVE